MFISQESLILLAEYPRRYRLGLIEAEFIPSEPRAPAGYPRRYRLGLIEASQRTTPVVLMPLNIRGVIASASLKHRPGQ